jgi:PRTRC genetic system protein E
MFQELMPLLSQRVLILTLSRATDEEVCVNVIPKPLKSDQNHDDTALTTPLAVTGTPKELDEHLPRQLVEFVATHLELSSTLKIAKEQMDIAAKAAREAAKKSTSKSPSGSTRPVTVRNHTEAEDAPNSNESQSSNDPTKATATSGGAADSGASTGNLFDAEVKADV